MVIVLALEDILRRCAAPRRWRQRQHGELCRSRDDAASDHLSCSKISRATAIGLPRTDYSFSSFFAFS